MIGSKLKGELNHALHPRTTVYRWVTFYLLLLVVLYFAFSIFTSQYRTYRVPTGSVELTIPYVTYLVGEPITFTVKNGFESTIYIPNECPEEPLTVYKLVDKKWQRLHAVTSPSSCVLKDRQISVSPHGTQNGNYTSWPELFKDPGKYRVVAYIDYFNMAPYQDFEIIEKPEKQKIYVQTRRQQINSPPNISPTQPPTGTPPPTSDPNPQPTLIPYSVSTSAGSITVEYSPSYIYVRSIVPSTSCNYEGGRSGASIEVTFKCPGDETQIQLWLSSGTIRQKIES